MRAAGPSSRPAHGGAIAVVAVLAVVVPCATGVLAGQELASARRDSLLSAVQGSALGHGDGADVFRIGGRGPRVLVAVGSTDISGGGTAPTVRRVAEVKARREAAIYLHGVLIRSELSDMMRSAGGRDSQEVTEQITEIAEGRVAQSMVLGVWESRDGRQLFVAVYIALDSLSGGARSP